MKPGIFKTLLAGGLTALTLASGAAQAQTQGYPNRPVRAIITLTAGSSTDIVARVVFDKVSQLWGQPVVFDNRAGAGGSIGATAVVTSAPDGYTLLIDSSAHAVTPSMYAKLPYDTLKDFTDISGLAIQPNILVVRADSPHKTMMELVNFAKANPGKLNFASAGTGTGTHLNLEKFVNAAGIKVTHVPYKGTPEVLSGLVSGVVDCYWGPISATLALVQSGKLRPLAVSTPKRSSQLPDVPTTTEAGVANADAPLWFGVWGPKGMPKDLSAKIAADIHKALEDPEIKKKLATLGNDTLDMSQADFGKFVHDETVNYAKIIKAAGIVPQ